MKMQVKQSGFSLIEVMVALMIVAVSLGGVVYTVGNMAHNQSIIGERVFARWVAANRLAEIQLEGKWPSIGTSNGTETMAGTEWRWEQKTLATPDEDVRRVEITVTPQEGDDGAASAKLIGFIAQ